MKKLVILILLIASIISSCNNSQICKIDNSFTSVDTLIKQTAFQKVVDGKKTDLFVLKNDSGLVVKITNYGARVVSILTKDKHGKYADIALGYSYIEGYLADKMNLGCTVGRYANRIAKGKFKLDGKEYFLALNNGPNTLHGGLKGFDKVVWDAVQRGDTLSMAYTSNDMEEGFPGQVIVHLKYILTNENELKIEYEATTNKKTVINLTNHTYFNLHGEGIENILDHQIQIAASRTTPVDKNMIPTGELANVKGTPFDFLVAEFVGKHINDDNEQLKNGKGFDHNWVLDKKEGELGLAVVLTDTLSGRVLELYTTEPGVQFYTGNFMNGSTNGKSGKPHAYRTGLALEPQHFPDSPNKPQFPSTVYKPGDVYKQLSIFKFDVKK